MAYGFTYTLPTITGSHTDFPVVLKTADFPAAALDGTANAIDNGGGNLRAYTTSAKTTQLPLEVVTLVSSGSPDAEVWVKIPTAATGNTIYLEADDVATVQPAVTDTYGRNAVWSDYEAVYHLGEAVNTTAGGYINSSGNADATGFNLALPSTTGQIGDAQDLDGSNDYISSPASTFTAAEDANAFTVQAWVNMDSLLADGAVIGSWSGSLQFLLWMDEGGASANYRLGVSSGGSNTFTSADSGGAISGSWQKVTGTWDGTTVAVYLDGSSNASTAGALTMQSSSNAVGIGSDAGTGSARPLNGQVDEVRIRASVVSADWEATEHSNQSSSAAWGTVGAWEADAPAVDISGSHQAQQATHSGTIVLQDVFTVSGSHQAQAATHTGTITAFDPAGGVNLDPELISIQSNTEALAAVSSTAVISLTSNTESFTLG